MSEHPLEEQWGMKCWMYLKGMMTDSGFWPVLSGDIGDKLRRQSLSASLLEHDDIYLSVWAVFFLSKSSSPGETTPGLSKFLPSRRLHPVDIRTTLST